MMTIYDTKIVLKCVYGISGPECKLVDIVKES